MSDTVSFKVLHIKRISGNTFKGLVQAVFQRDEITFNIERSFVGKGYTYEELECLFVIACLDWARSALEHRTEDVVA